MEAVGDLYVNAEPYERGEARRTYRNDYKSRQKRSRKVSKSCEELFGEGISHERVRELDEGLSAWRERRLDVEAFPYGIVDARYEKARVDGRVVDIAVFIAVGVSESGKRHLLGVEVAHGETRTGWSAFFSGLMERGLRGVELLVSDAHASLADARRRHFPGTPWQRCHR